MISDCTSAADAAASVVNHLPAIAGTATVELIAVKRRQRNSLLIHFADAALPSRQWTLEMTSADIRRFSRFQSEAVAQLGLLAMHPSQRRWTTRGRRDAWLRAIGDVFQRSAEAAAK
jgi:hypothetical protein